MLQTPAGWIWTQSQLKALSRRLWGLQPNLSSRSKVPPGVLFPRLLRWRSILLSHWKDRWRLHLAAWALRPGLTCWSRKGCSRLKSAPEKKTKTVLTARSVLMMLFRLLPSCHRDPGPESSRLFLFVFAPKFGPTRDPVFPLSRLPQLVGVATQLQGGSSGATAASSGQPSGELQAGGVRPPPPLGTFSEPRRGHDSSPGADSGPGPASNLTSVPVLPTTALLLPVCPEESPLLVGPMLIEFNIPVDLELLAKQNPEVKVGGRYTPKDCISPHKVAIIIPFRNRQEHLKYWLYYLHPILQRQQLDYGIYVINQAGDSMFNRAKLLNIGFQEALKDYDYNCFVFSDVDLIPMDDHNAYRCFSQPRHISVAMDKFGFSLPYVQYFGGVSALSKDQFLAINGFPNNYWGWGGEDDDIFNRLVFRGMSISRPNAVVGRCRMIRHSRDKKNEPNPQRFDRIAHTKETMRSDGLNSLTYQVLDIQRNPLYTKITVDIGTPS